MKKKSLLKLSVSIAISIAALTGCSKGPKPNDPDVYRNKTGIIGVFRQSAFYCENVMPQYMTLGPQKIMVKSGWSNEQDKWLTVRHASWGVDRTSYWKGPDWLYSLS